MPESFNNDIERLSKLAAENFLAVEKAPAWNSIEEMLDKEMPVNNNKRKFVLFFFLMAGLLAGGFFIYTQQTNVHSEKAIVTKKLDGKAGENNNTSSAKSENILSNKTKEQEIKPIAENKSSEQQTQKPTSHSLIKENNYALNTHIGKQKNVSVKSAVTLANNTVNNDTQKVFENSTTEKNKPSLSNNNAGSFSGNSTGILKDDEQKNIENNTAALTRPQSKNTYFDSSSLTKNKNNQTAIPPESMQQQSFAKNNGKKKNIPERFFIAAQYGNDLSTVHFTNNDKPGTSFGILAGYDFSKRWSVRSGIIFSKKEYITNGSNFQLDASKLNLPAYNTLQLEEVNALSHIIEVPLNIRYRFNPGKKSGFFVSTGLSAYFTKWEDMDYSILLDGNRTVDVERTYHANEEDDIHLIGGVFDLSAGWQTRINNRLSFELEPSAKLPFTKMGVGEIRLMSFGINVTLSYRPFNKNKNSR